MRNKAKLEEIFTNHISDRGFVARVYKQLLEFNNRKSNNPIKKWAKDMNRPYTKKDLQLV